MWLPPCRLRYLNCLQRNKYEDVEMYPDVFVHSKRIIEGLSNINIICSSSGLGGQTTEMGKMLFRTVCSQILPMHVQSFIVMSCVVIKML